MARSITFILLILIDASQTACESPDEPQATSQQHVEPTPAQKPDITSPASTFLDRFESAVDHDEKYRQKPPPDPEWITFGSLHTPRPATWIWKPPSSTLRIANYTLPGVEGSEAAELSVIQFAPGEGGDIQSNINRWKLQFRSTAGGPVRPRVSTTTVAQLPTTITEINGEYMGMGAAWHHYNYTMLTAMLECEDGNIFLRLLGPAKTIDAHRDSWNQMLREITIVE